MSIFPNSPFKVAHHLTKIPFSIEPTSGNIRLDNVQLHANQPKAQIEREIGHLVTGSRDHMNGYEWLYLGGLTFHGHPSKLYLRFHNERLCEALWHVELPDAPQDRDGRRERPSTTKSHLCERHWAGTLVSTSRDGFCRNSAGEKYGAPSTRRAFRLATVSAIRHNDNNGS
jgi:hypothetical protein